MSEYYTSGVQTLLNRSVVIRIDIDADQLSQRIKSDIALNGDAHTLLSALSRSLKRSPSPELQPQVVAMISEFRERGVRAAAQQSSDFNGKVSMSWAVARLNTLLPADSVVIPDAGNHWLDTLALFKAHHAGGIQLNCGLGAMGWAIGASVGMAFANPSRKTICVTGDASMLMHGAELSVAAEHGANLLILIFNNHAHGRVRLGQKMDFDGDILGTDLPPINFAQWMSAMGIRAFKVTTSDSYDETVKAAISFNGTAAVEIDCHPDEVPACLRNWIGDAP